MFSKGRKSPLLFCLSREPCSFIIHSFIHSLGQYLLSSSSELGDKPQYFFTPWPALSFLPIATTYPAQGPCPSLVLPFAQGSHIWVFFDFATCIEVEGGRRTPSLASALSPSFHRTTGPCPSQALARIPSHPGTALNLSQLSPWDPCPWASCRAHPVLGPQHPGPWCCLRRELPAFWNS